MNIKQWWIKWWVKWPLVILTTILAIILIVPLVPLGFLRPAVESKLSDTLGRKVTVESVYLRLLGGTYLTINGMTAKEDPAFSDGDMIKAEKVSADFSLYQYLFHGQVIIDGLSIKSPDLTFTKNRDGVWSWTTIGNNESDEQAAARPGEAEDAQPRVAALPVMLVKKSSPTILNKITVEGASVQLVDLTKDRSSDRLYKNIRLRASLTTTTREDSNVSRHITGELDADSSEEAGARALKTTLPFDLNIYRDPKAGLMINGSLGPGPLETKTFLARSFTLNCLLNSPRKNKASQSQQSSSLRGQGHISCSDVMLTSVNVSQKIAERLQVPAVGDTAPGTSIVNLETDFQIDQGTYYTPGLQIKELDGVGDATSENGWFKFDPGLVLNYPIKVAPSEQLRSQIKSTNPIIADIVKVVEANIPLAVALNITGDARNPQVKVDLLRTLGF